MQRDLFGKARQVKPDRRRHLCKLKRKVTITGRVHAVGRGSRKAQLSRSDGAIELQRRTRDRARSKRAHIHPRTRVLQTSDVAHRHLEIGHQPVRHQHRLRSLQMGIARHGTLAGSLRNVEQGSSPCAQVVDRAVDRVTHVQPKISRNLLVA